MSPSTIPPLPYEREFTNLSDRLHRLDLLPPNFVSLDTPFRQLSTKEGEQIGIDEKKRTSLSTEFAETHFSRKQLPTTAKGNNGASLARRPSSWGLFSKVSLSRMLNGAEIMTQNHRALATCSKVTTDL